MSKRLFGWNNTASRACLAVVLALAFSLVGFKTASALTLSPDPGATGIPTVNRNVLQSCDSPGAQNPPHASGFTTWISPTGTDSNGVPYNASETNITVPYGAASATFAYHWAGVVCLANNDVSETHQEFDGQNPAAGQGTVVGLQNDYYISGLSDDTAGLPGNAKVGDYKATRIGNFTFYPDGGFTQTSYTLTLNMRMVNSYYTGPGSTADAQFHCVGPTKVQDPSGPTDYSHCQYFTQTVTINVTFSPPAPVVQGYKIADDGNGSHDNVSPGASDAGQPYPFSDDAVYANGPTNTYSGGNKFTFPSGSGNVLSPGNYSFSQTDSFSDNGKWAYKGFTICDEAQTAPGNCNSSAANENSFLANSSHIVGSASLADGHSYDIRLIYSKGATIISGTNCPGNATTLGFPLVTINLPNKTPSDSTHGTAGKTGSDPNPNQTYYQDVETITNATRAQDDTSAIISGAASDGSIKLYDQNQTAHTARVDYSPYVQDYPYDKNVASVTYTTSYTEQKYTTSSTPSGYTCPNSGTASGSTCKYGATPATTYCTQGGLYNSQNGHCYDYGDNSKYPTCPSGYTAFLGICLKDLGASNTVTTYSCNSGPGNVSRSGSTCSYTGTAYYNWSMSGSSSTQTTGPNTVDGSIMNACFGRAITTTIIGSGGNYDNSEDPTSANFNATVNVAFSAGDGGPNSANLRQPAEATLSQNYSSPPWTCSQSPPFTVSGGYSIPTSGTASISTSCGVSAPPLVLGQQTCATVTVNPEYGDSAAGGGISGGYGSVSANPCTGPVHNEPYLKVYGGDVSAGNGFESGATCTNNPSADIKAYNNNGPTYSGASTNLAALLANSNSNPAAGVIQMFATARSDTGIPTITSTINSASTPSALAFANVSTSGTAHPSGSTDINYGEGMGSGDCMHDYMSDAGGTVSTASSANVSNLPNTEYTFSGPVNSLSQSSPLGAGKHMTIYVKGDVTITSNITYAGAFASVADIPSFELVASGNIYVDSGVTQLDGSYIAQGHTIYTCSSGGSPVTPSFNTCASRLTINGAFAASNIVFDRMGGASADDGSLRFSGADTGPGANNAAEEFDYSPMLWLSEQASTNNNTPYDSITSLPPVL